MKTFKDLYHEKKLIEYQYEYRAEISRVLENQEKPYNDDTGGKDAKLGS